MHSQRYLSLVKLLDISAYYGGAIYVNLNSNITIVDTYFERNNAYLGGVMYVSDLSYLEIEDSYFTNNFASYAAVFRISTSSYFKIIGSELFYNYAYYKDSIGQIVETSSDSYINDTSFTNNYFYESSG